MEKTGGFLPLLAPIIAGIAALGGLGGLAGGVASAVNSTREASEKARHNREIEKLTAQSLTKEGGTMYGPSYEELMNRAPRSINPMDLAYILKSKYDLGGNTKGLRGAVWGNGLYLEREGSGLF